MYQRLYPAVIPQQVQNEFESIASDHEAFAALTGARLTDAVRANRILARQIGWGCVIGGQVSPIPQLRTRLGLSANPTEEELAKAIAKWQETETGRAGDGKLGNVTWRRMRLLPAPQFRQYSVPVYFGGKKLGVLEKSAPYLNCYFGPGDNTCHRSRRGVANEAGGAQIELGFRVTDMDAVRRAGFVDGAGEDNFRWVQVVDFITVPNLPTGTFIRRSTRIIDPTALVGAQPDPHPYYWDWARNVVTPAGFDDNFHVRHFLDRQGRNGLCYDLIFTDLPRFRLTAAQPGRRAYFAFQVALVGVRPGNRNVILNSVRWGYDLVIRSGVPEVRLAAIRSGPRGGSSAMRQTLGRAIRNGDFPGHCFVGSGFGATATCR